MTTTTKFDATGWTCEGAIYVQTDHGRRVARLLYRGDSRYVLVRPDGEIDETGGVGDGRHKQLKADCQPLGR